MTSILTNTAAMAALQTLRSIDGKMQDTQARVSSGLRVGTAADNAAYWSIATTMRSDNGALSAVQDALGLGAAKVDTAYAAMESVVDVVKEIKNKLVAAREAGVDRAKIQEEIAQLQDQLKAIAESASFSGENWLKANISDGDATNPVVQDVTKQVVGSFIRSADGTVGVKTIDITLNDSSVLFDTSGDNFGILDTEAVEYDQARVKIDGKNYVFAAVHSDTVDDTFTEDANGVWSAAGVAPFYVKVGEEKWVLSDAAGVIDTTDAEDSGDINHVANTSVAEFNITELSSYAALAATGASEGEILDVLIQHLDTQLEAVIGATAALGSVSMRIGMQEEFINSLTDSIDRGIGRLVDADMNEESTRLKALQTQQQLGIQSLSIANTASENILTLFRQ
nr:flagellin [Rhizobium sp. Q54]